MSRFTALALGAVAWLAAGSTAFADVHLTMQDGRVTLVAKDATVRQILAEWAKVGQTKIVNAERVPGGPVTLELTNVPEQTALDVLLRSVSGYMAAPRPTPQANLSRFDRVIVMPTSVAPAAPPARAAAPPPPVFPQPGVGPQFGQQILQQQPAEDDDERPMPNGVVPNRGPVFNAFPPPQVVNPQGGPAMAPGVVVFPQAPQVPPAGGQVANPSPVYPGMPSTPFGGTAVPGVIVQPPPPPNQTQPGVTTPPRRPGGR